MTVENKIAGQLEVAREKQTHGLTVTGLLRELQRATMAERVMEPLPVAEWCQAPFPRACLGTLVTGLLRRFLDGRRPLQTY